LGSLGDFSDFLIVLLLVVIVVLLYVAVYILSNCGLVIVITAIVAFSVGYWWHGKNNANPKNHKSLFLFGMKFIFAFWLQISQVLKASGWV